MTSNDPIQIKNGSPKGQSSPAQSLLTLPTNDPPTNHSAGGLSEVASVQNGKSLFSYGFQKLPKRLNKIFSSTYLKNGTSAKICGALARKNAAHLKKFCSYMNFPSYS